MSNMHVLESSPNDGSSRIVMHYPIPAGNNAAGITWAAAIVAAGLNKSVMSIGTGAGQITTAEMSTVTAGTVFEHATDFVPDPFTNVRRLAQLDALYTTLQTTVQNELRARLQYYGFTR